MSQAATGTLASVGGGVAALPWLAQIESPPGEPPYAALLFAATFVSLLGVFLTLHGGAAYALLVWEGAAGVAAWVYLDPIVGVFFFLAATVQAPLAAHLWGDPLSVRPRLWWLLQTLIAAAEDRQKG
ncbi:hypothetical protein [Halobaculum marinum]|uniref:Uncharacterized protein n=1 Tax=Halobaculum marinum TaxID=3031996 RepID=A0ABD5WZX8_9EURY|nr:hypothetical protein [Halobaculum sp. DT55]